MTLYRRIAVRGAVLALLAGSVGSAQQIEMKDPHRWAAAVALDVGSMPDDFVTPCPSGGGAPFAGVGLGVLARPRRWLIAAADTRASATPGLGCKLSIPAPVQIGPNEYENYAAKQYPNGVPEEALVRTALHLGVETPSGSPLLRATLGGGVIWSGSRTPFATAAVGAGSRGRGARFYTELEAGVCRVRTREEHTRFRLESGDVRTPLPSRTVLRVANLAWTTLHLGLEVPLASMR